MVGFPSSSGGGGGAAAAGWTQIATSTPTGVGTVDFTSIPQTYAELFIEITGLSHNNGSNTGITMHVSPDGASWGTGVSLTSGPATDTYYGGAHLPRYTSGAGTMAISLSNQSSSPIVGNGIERSWRCDGGIAGVRFILGAGNFDAGTITLYGR